MSEKTIACTKCETVYPATEKFFSSRQRESPSGALRLRRSCRDCERKYQRAYHHAAVSGVAWTEQERPDRRVHPISHGRRRKNGSRPSDGKKSCSHCHSTYPATLEFFRRDGYLIDGTVQLRAWCHRCEAEYTRAWLTTTAGKAYRCRQYRRSHTRIRREQQATYWRHVDARRAMARVYHATHRDESRAYGKQWRREHPDQDRGYSALKRARKRNAEGHYTEEDVASLLKAQDGCCYYCRSLLKKGWHLDHKMPLSRGGTNWPTNLCCACESCNLRKRTKTDTEFIAQLARGVA